MVLWRCVAAWLSKGVRFDMCTQYWATAGMVLFVVNYNHVQLIYLLSFLSKLLSA
jgi:hypothetical protein